VILVIGEILLGLRTPVLDALLNARSAG
jgi:hypothetical protein